jgi:multidrug resistance efflux pump
VAAIDDYTQQVTEPRGFGRFAGVALFIAALAAVVAGATIWLLVTDPVTTAMAVESGQVTPLVRELADLLYQAVAGLLGYL